MKRGVIILVLVCFLIFNGLIINALRITEVELNPIGRDEGNEWIEIYDNNRIDLRDYRIENHDGKEIVIDEKMDGYYVYQFENQWLDNTGEKISIYKGNKLVFETDKISDNKNDNKTWSFCEKEWIFGEPTKEYGNRCEKKIPILNNTEDNKTESTNNFENVNNQIVLTPQSIKTINDEENLSKKRSYAFYGLIIFCILLFVLFGLKFFKKKNGII